jgi:hypothetical protein
LIRSLLRMAIGRTIWPLLETLVCTVRRSYRVLLGWQARLDWVLI